MAKRHYPAHHDHVDEETDGLDCMSCAWPDPDPEHRHKAEFCENGTKAVAEEATTARATPEFLAKYRIVDLDGRSEHWLGQQGRITHPMIKRPGATHYEPIDWDAAFGVIAAELRALDDPNEALFYTSGRTSNEAAYQCHLVVQTLPSHDQYNTTIYGLSDRYRGIEGGRRVVLVNPADIEHLGFEEGDLVDLITHWPGDRHVRRAPSFRIVGYQTPGGSAAAYHPETNPLVPLDSTALGSNTPTSKSVIIRMVPVGSPPTMDDPRSQRGPMIKHKSYPQPEYLG